MRVKKFFENRLIFGEDMDKSLRLTFWATLYIVHCSHSDTFLFTVNCSRKKQTYKNTNLTKLNNESFVRILCKYG